MRNQRLAKYQIPGMFLGLMISSNSTLAGKQDSVIGDFCAITRSEIKENKASFEHVKKNCMPGLLSMAKSNAYRRSSFSRHLAFATKDLVFFEKLPADTHHFGSPEMIGGASNGLKNAIAVSFYNDSTLGTVLGVLDNVSKKIFTIRLQGSGNFTYSRFIENSGFDRAVDLAFSNSQNKLFVALNPRGSSPEIWIYRAKANFIGREDSTLPDKIKSINLSNSGLTRVLSLYLDDAKSEISVLGERGHEKEVHVYEISSNSLLPKKIMSPAESMAESKLRFSARQ